VSQAISLFPRYSSPENRATNYTLLVLRLLYEESPRLYQQFLDRLLGEDAPATLPTFLQQQKKKSSIPDGVVSQRSYALYVETKTGEWFYDEQLRRHLSALADDRAETKMLIALSPFEYGGETALMTQYKAEAAKYSGVGFLAVSFRSVVDALPALDAGSHLGRIIEEFETYLADADLLGSWQTQLDVVNTAMWPEHVAVHQVYTCPATGGAYAHRRCRFLGGYAKKTVTHVAEILGVVRLGADGHGAVEWKNVEIPDIELVASASDRATAAWGGREFEIDRLAFVLGSPVATAFTKDTPGGMRGSRQYFELAKLPGGTPTDAVSLAAALNGRHWTEVA
jgi:hypothetical protein